MDPRVELVGRVARHATEMAAFVEYDDAANAAAQALIEFTPMSSVAQVRLPPTAS